MQSFFFLMMMLGILAITDMTKVTEYNQWTQHAGAISYEMMDATQRASAWCKATANCGQSGTQDVPAAQLATQGSTSYTGAAATGVIKAGAIYIGAQRYIIVTYYNTGATMSKEASYYMYGAVIAQMSKLVPDTRWVGSYNQQAGTFQPAGFLGGQAANTIALSSTPTAAISLSQGQPMIVLPSY
jgi:hypothetical protein